MSAPASAEGGLGGRGSETDGSAGTGVEVGEDAKEALLGRDLCLGCFEDLVAAEGVGQAMP